MPVVPTSTVAVSSSVTGGTLGSGVPVGFDGWPVAVPTLVVFWLTVAVLVQALRRPGASSGIVQMQPSTLSVTWMLARWVSPVFVTT